MSPDVIDLIRDANPLPQELPSPPMSERLSARGRRESPPPAHRAANPRARRPLARPLAVGAAALLAAVVGLALVGLPGGGRFDVAAAIYRALGPSSGVLYLVDEQEAPGGGFHLLEKRWRTVDPPRERSVIVQNTVQRSGRHLSWTGESAIPAGGTWSTWSTAHPSVVEVTRARGILLIDEMSALRAAYRAGRLHVVGRTRVAGRLVYRARVTPLRGRDGRAQPDDVVLFDARTFAPVEMTDYGRSRHGGGPVPTYIVRWRVFEDLPATPANLGLLVLRPHPGTRLRERP
jgi:hypothetical protein